MDWLRKFLATLSIIILVARVVVLDHGKVYNFKMYYVMQASAPSLHRQSNYSLITEQ